MHRNKPGGKILITITKSEENLEIEISDNGIGRDAAAKLKRKKNKLNKSHGMQITAERLSIMNDLDNVNTGVTVTDLYNDKNESTGTKILLTISYKTNAGNNN